MRNICPLCKEPSSEEQRSCVCGYEFNMSNSDLSDISKDGICFSNIKIINNPTSLEILIPVKTKVLTMFYYGSAIIVWAILEIILVSNSLAIIRTGNQKESIILLFAIGSMTIFGGFMIWAWLWNIVGKEHIVLSPSKLIIKKAIFGYGLKHIYDLHRIKDLCIGDEHQPFVFIYDSERYSFGLSINNEEAQYILKEIYKRNYIKAG